MNENSGMPPTNTPAPQPQAAAPADIDMSFLQQFSCMGTSDHDELAQQLQLVIGGPMSINLNTAKFFLEMNNWNLQGAVGSYFDYHPGIRLPSMRHISTGEISSVQPNTQFSQSWLVQNNGDDAWPAGCYARYKAPATTVVVQLPPNVPIAAAPANTLANITVSMLAPADAGVYKTEWQLCTANGSVFGDILLALVQVEPSANVDDAMAIGGGAGGGIGACQDGSTAMMMMGGDVLAVDTDYAMQQQLQLQQQQQQHQLLPQPPPPSPSQQQQSLEQQPQQQQQQQQSEDTEMC